MSKNLRPNASVDDYIPTPERDSDKPFMMPVEDVFSITGRGTVATGRVERGQIKVGEEIEIIGMQEESSKTTVTGVEMFRKLLDYEAVTTLVHYYVVFHVKMFNVVKF